MAKDRRISTLPLRDLAQAAAGLREPGDYFTGRRRPVFEVPDNILLFLRASSADLNHGTLEPHFHHRWVLIVALAGRGTVLVDGAAFPFRPGSALLVPPLRLHRYADIAPGRVCWLFLTFEMPGGGAASAPEASRLTAEGRAGLHLILRLWRREDPSASVSARLATQTALLLLSLRRGATPVAALPSPPAALLDRVNRWIASRRAPFHIADLGAGIGVSESHLRALFRSHFGLSLGRYIRETRCRLAAMRLRQGGISVTEAAAACGFGSVYSFSRTFKRVLGVSPRRMREMAHGASSPGMRPGGISA